MSIKRYILSVWAAVVCATAFAGEYGKPALQHHLSVTVQGGEANALFRSESASINAGADAAIAFAYELQSRRVFFNVGIGAEYALLRQSASPFSDSFARQDKEGEALTYSYTYSALSNSQQQLSVVVPVQLGVYITPWLYGAVGAKLISPGMWTQSRTKAQMLTEGAYERFIGSFREVDTYTFYPEDTYIHKNSLQSDPWKAGFSAEIGTQFSIGKRTSMRAGIFAEYILPFSAKEKTSLTDYSAVDVSPLTGTQQRLRESISFNPLLTSDRIENKVSGLTAGIRLSFLLNVTRSSYPCRCEQDY